MNGRLYDPILGRMLSPDPYVQMPDFAQNFNRYSYCWNNPLVYTDPDGEFIILGLIRGAFDAIFSGALEFWNYDKAYTHKAMLKANPFIEGTAGNNSIKIWGGYFKGPLFGKQFVQNTLGMIFGHTANVFGDVKGVQYYNGATVVIGSHDGLFWGHSEPAVTLGNFIIGDKTIEANPRNELFQHEFGHVLQSREAGYKYLGQYAKPSLFSKRETHSHHPVEQDANARAYKYFMENERGFGSNDWIRVDNPIDGYDWNQPFTNIANQQILTSLVIKPADWYFPVLFPLYHSIYYRSIQP